MSGSASFLGLLNPLWSFRPVVRTYCAILGYLVHGQCGHFLVAEEVVESAVLPGEHSIFTITRTCWLEFPLLLSPAPLSYEVSSYLYHPPLSSISRIKVLGLLRLKTSKHFAKSTSLKATTTATRSRWLGVFLTSSKAIQCMLTHDVLLLIFAEVFLVPSFRHDTACEFCWNTTFLSFFEQIGLTACCAKLYQGAVSQSTLYELCIDCHCACIDH